MNQNRPVPTYAIHKDGLISGFFGEFSFLSNFWELENGIGVGNLYFKTVENAYQAAKWPEHLRSQFVNISESKVKQLGRNAPNLNLKSWNKKKYDIMCDFVFQKFDKNYKLKNMLIATDGYLLEERNNWNDIWWGCDVNGIGENNLGKILMLVREKLIAIKNKTEF